MWSVDLCLPDFMGHVVPKTGNELYSLRVVEKTSMSVSSAAKVGHGREHLSKLA